MAPLDFLVSSPTSVFFSFAACAPLGDNDYGSGFPLQSWTFTLKFFSKWGEWSCRLGSGVAPQSPHVKGLAPTWHQWEEMASSRGLLATEDTPWELISSPQPLFFPPILSQLLWDQQLCSLPHPLPCVALIKIIWVFFDAPSDVSASEKWSCCAAQPGLRLINLLPQSQQH